MRLFSSFFENGESIPKRFTCEGANISPPLSWEGLPERTKSLALLLYDPDAPRGTFTHWILFNIPLMQSELVEGVSSSDKHPQAMREGFNDFGNLGYGGPCPPRGGGTHRYFFRLYALDQALDFSGHITRSQLLDAMQDHVIDEAVLLGKYKRT